MCGIVGYVGWRNATEVLLEGLKNLEYRGYDSSGIVVHLGNGEFFYTRAEGKLQNLIPKIQRKRPLGSSGIGHTRWATHGKPSEYNAHPHNKKGVFVVHNGIIENYNELKLQLTEKGVEFYSETDTEVFAALLEQGLEHGLSPEASFRSALSQVKGSYAFVTLFEADPDRLWVARIGSPLVLGIGDEENIVASDIPALLAYTDRMISLEDGESACLSAVKIEVWANDGTLIPEESLKTRIKKIPWTLSMAQKDGYKHFMLKEIFEQPLSIAQTLFGRLRPTNGMLSLDGLEECLAHPYHDIHLVACGTSFHAALLGKYYIENFAKLPTFVEQAPEFRYRDPLVGPESLVLGISQSGETIDTLYALKRSKEKSAVTAAICNVLDSSIPRAVDHTLYTRAGPEIGVASTKAFTTQLLAILLAALRLGIHRQRLNKAELRDIANHLRSLPEKMTAVLKLYAKIRSLSEQYIQTDHLFFMSRGPLYPIALEGALKLKEISYIHAEGYAAGELKHGTIALIEENTPVIAILSQDQTYREKMLSNIEEVHARGAEVIVIAPDTTPALPSYITEFLPYPTVPWYLEPILAIVPLQLFAYSVADLKGTDVDQPRNLAKSVTVE